MIADLLVDPLLLVGGFWLCILHHVVWPYDRATPCPMPPKLPPPRRKRSTDPKPFAGLLPNPLGEAGERAPAPHPQPPSAPPPVLTCTRGRKRPIDTQIEGRLRSQQKLLGKIVGVMFPALFGCRTPSELCRVRGWDKLSWARTRIDDRLAALRTRGLELPPPIITGDSCFGDSQLMTHVRQQHQGTFLVEGKTTSTFTFADGRQVTGHDLLEGEWPWRDHPWEPRVRYVRWRAMVMVDEPRQDRFYVLCLETTLSGPQLIRRWRRRHWIEFVFRVLKHLLATESCQAHSDDAYYGHLVLRLIASFVLFSTSRVMCKGRLTMEEIIFSLKHYWRFVDMEPLELQALSCGSWVRCFYLSQKPLGVADAVIEAGCFTVGAIGWRL